MRKKGIRRTYARLNQMLDEAMNGTFEETAYDETELSKLETRWKRFLVSAQLSRQNLEKERRDIQEMVSDISHQTRTPLSNILLYAQLLEEQELEDDSREMVREIRKQSEKLDFLIQSLVKTSRLEAGTFQLTPQKQDVFPMLEEILSEAQQKANGKQIEILLEEAESRVCAVYDKKWTSEALYNILDNAVKYSHEKSQVVISVVAYELFVCLKISDRGMGIPEEEIPLIFQRFYRGRQVKEEEGVGIGLYLARQIIEEQNGYIRVESKPKKGSSFFVYLPRSQ